MPTAFKAKQLFICADSQLKVINLQAFA